MIQYWLFWSVNQYKIASMKAIKQNLLHNHGDIILPECVEKIIDYWMDCCMSEELTDRLIHKYIKSIQPPTQIFCHVYGKYEVAMAEFNHLLDKRDTCKNCNFLALFQINMDNYIWTDLEIVGHSPSNPWYNLLDYTDYKKSILPHPGFMSFEALREIVTSTEFQSQITWDETQTKCLRMPSPYSLSSHIGGSYPICFRDDWTWIPAIIHLIKIKNGQFSQSFYRPQYLVCLLETEETFIVRGNCEFNNDILNEAKIASSRFLTDNNGRSPNNTDLTVISFALRHLLSNGSGQIPMYLDVYPYRWAMIESNRSISKTNNN